MENLLKTKKAFKLQILKKYKRGLLRTVFSGKGSHSLLHDAVSHRIDEVCDVLSGKRIPKRRNILSPSY